MNTQYRNKKQTQLEIDIESARTHKDWATVWNLFRKYSKVNPDSVLEALAHAEHALDNYDVSQARTCLDKAKAADPENEEVFALYGRLEFVAKDFEKSYGYLSLIHMPPNDQFLFPRTLRLLLQSWQLKGLCQEARHEYKQAANTYKELLDLAVRSSNNLTTLDVLAKPFVETALCNLPLLQFDDVFSSVQLSRQALYVPFELSPNSLHSTLRHLAHLLLRDTCAASYPQLQEDPGSSALRYTPRTANEEALLALLKSSHDNPSPIDLYEDISLAYCRLSLYSPIVDAYERLLSFQIGDVHQLMQLALALMSSGRYRRALYVMQDCVTRDPTNPIFLLLTVKICVNHLRMPVLGLEYADKAENCLEDKPENWVWLARARMAVGICYGKLGLEAKTFEERKVYQKRALHYLLLARQLDPNDASIAFNLALVYADIRDITRALKYVRRSLTLDRTNSNSWGLLSLLLSSQKRFTVAHSVLSQALAEDPTNICLTLIKAKLEQMLDEPVQALQTYRTAFGHYAIIREEQTPKQPEPKLGAGSVHSAESARTAETRTTHRRTITSADVNNVSVALSQARSHVLSLHTNPRDGPDDEGVSTASDPALTNLWLATADAFTQAGQVSDAVDCLQEARALDDNNAALFYQEGCMLELQDQLQEALVQYHRCLSVDYNHVMARVRIAMISMKAKDFNLAEQLLSSLLRLEPTCHQAWFHLGCVLKEKPGEEKRAAECFQRAVELDKTAPVMPFSTIARLIP